MRGGKRKSVERTITRDPKRGEMVVLVPHTKQKIIKEKVALYL